MVRAAGRGPAEPTPSRRVRPGGRRPGDSGTREAILQAARRGFAEVGFRATTIRAIAREAGVGPALVHHFYGSKSDLFAAAMTLPVNPGRELARALDGGIEDLGARIVAVFVRTWDDPVNQPSLLGILRALVGNDASAVMARDFISTQILRRVADQLPVADREWRTGLVGSQLAGLAVARYLLEVEPLHSASAAEVVAAVGPTLQRYLTGDLESDH